MSCRTAGESWATSALRNTMAGDVRLYTTTGTYVWNPFSDELLRELNNSVRELNKNTDLPDVAGLNFTIKYEKAIPGSGYPLQLTGLPKIRGPVFG
jgi:hypothetical protein